MCGASLLALRARRRSPRTSHCRHLRLFRQGFGVSIVNGLNKAKDEFGVDLKLVDTGNRALDYEEQFDNVAKGGQYDLIFVMGWELVDALQKASGRLSRTSASCSSTAC